MIAAAAASGAVILATDAALGWAVSEATKGLLEHDEAPGAFGGIVAGAFEGALTGASYGAGLGPEGALPVAILGGIPGFRQHAVVVACQSPVQRYAHE